MKRGWIAGVAVFVCGGLGVWWIPSFISSTPVAPRTAPAPVSSTAAIVLPKYQRYSLPNSEIHTVTIAPQSRFKVAIALSSALETLDQFAKSQKAIAVLNGGFFDPKNEKTTSYVIQNGQVIGDPKQNDRLVQNPDLKPYLSQILERSEFRTYRCGDKTESAIAPHSAAIPSGCNLIDALGAGPQLLPKLTAVDEGFVDQQAGRDAIGMNQRNARSAIGIKRDGSIVLVMAAQRPNAPDSGMSVQAMVSFMQRLGVEQALNLDGGSSAGLIYQDQKFYGKVDESGRSVVRAIKSAIVVQ
ncbi:MAG TPA: phosphodiester glycosidase family protein, partial [Leptolyngbya sp.]|nr:phosphodiester glycosidase family protein [Leptolyngbya sp.]